MVFSNKHKILTKNLYQLKGYIARQLRTEFPNKGWMTSSNNRLGCLKVWLAMLCEFCIKFHSLSSTERILKMH